GRLRPGKVKERRVSLLGSSPAPSAATTLSAAAARLPLHVIVIDFLADLLLEVVLIFLDQRRISWRAIDIGRKILSFIELLLGPLVVNVRDLGLVDDLLRQMRRDEKHTLPIAEHDVARHHG